MDKIKMSLLLYIFRWIFQSIANMPLMATVIIAVAFIIVGWINLFTVPFNMGFLGEPVLQWLGFAKDGQYGEEAVLAAFAKVSFIGGIAFTVIRHLIQKIFGYDLKPARWIGFVFISVLFLISLISCFSKTAKPGASSIVPVLAFFWVVAIVLYAFHLFLKIPSDALDRFAITQGL